MRLILVRGLAGSGKTTFTQTMFDGVLKLETDMLCMKDGEYQWLSGQGWTRHELIRMVVNFTLGEGADVVVSNTFSTRWELEPYLKMGKMFGAKIIIYKMLGKFKSVHGVPEDVIDAMRNRWEDVEREIPVLVEPDGNYLIKSEGD
jgi:predicted kinase